MNTAAGSWSKRTILLHFMIFNILSSYGMPFSNVLDASQLDSSQKKPSRNRRLTQQSFSKSVYSFEVKEDTPPGTVVGNVEAVNHEGSTPIIYSVLEDDGEGLFLLSPHSGEFLLSRTLDYETARYYILTVAVQLSSVRVFFNVVDVNDNPPVFRQVTYSTSVTEDIPVGTCFLALSVSDKDYGVNGEMDIEVIAGDEKALFLVNPNGVLCLTGELDRERSSTYSLTVQANDHALPTTLRLTSTAHISVHIDDVNDNAPSFMSARSVTISEDTPLYTVVMVVHAVDVDIGSNGDVIYTLKDTSCSVFSINSTSGSLYLLEPLDREGVDMMTITLTATDKGSPRQATSMNLTVHVEDANDHNPEFSQDSYSLTVREDAPRGTSLLKVQAHDGDIGPNREVRYKLSQSSPFVVDSVRGVVSVIDRLDREKDPSYMFTVTAIDSGNIPRSSTAVINITVLDVNDFTPLFSPKTLTLHVLENGDDPSQLIHKVSAVDEDEGVNSQLTYFIEKGNGEGLFSLSPNGTFQILRNLDREVKSLYTIDIIAVDSGLPPLTGTASVHVVVDDVNDNRPAFTEDVFTTIISEDIPIGTVFAMITASDIDDGVSGKIWYELRSVDGPFSIDETSGELFTTGVLDREAVAIYSLTVVGSDTHPTHPLSGSVLVRVLVGDVNDYWPQFLNAPYVANVPVEMAPGSVVCAVRAIDGDTGINSQLQFSLYGQSAGQFSVSPHSGIVFTSSTLRGKDDITINVRVEDGGDYKKMDTTTVTIRFQNASEFPVLKVDVHRHSLTEDVPGGTLVAMVSAESSRRGPLSFYLVSGDFDEVFQLHQSSGVLTVNNPLDYEANKDFILFMEARDAGSPPFSSYAEIHINISDTNDNMPEFTQREYRCEVFENLQATWVCDVLAIDADSGSYGMVQYSILEGNVESAFTIDSENGMLSTKRSLDREEISEFNLTIEASDKDNTLYKDIAIVLVIVLDTNDHAPRFSQIFLTEIPEDTPIGYTVMQILSTDDDIGTNALIAYSVIDQSDDIPFSIDKTNGCITVVRFLDRETQDHYVVMVNANDSAWSISTDVTIDITDINDNRPVFSQHLYTVTVSETKAEEVFVMQVLATDADLGQNSQILYFIEPPSEEFWVNASTGDIHTKQPIYVHHSESQSLSFTCVAFDCGHVPLYSNTTITVTFMQLNYFPPTFFPSQSLLSIPFDMAVGTEVVQLSAVDQDFNHSSSAVEYSLGGGNASHFFVIEAEHGRVMLNQSLKQSLNALLTLMVIARDQGFPPLSSQTEISFEITGENQFAPQFSELYVTFSVPEDLPVGSVIGKIQAEDGDDGVNGFLSYYLTSGNEDLPFSLGKRSGLITLVEGLDYEKQGMYYLQIYAKDGGWISKMGTLNITVNINDVNDNPPVFTASKNIVSVPENVVIGTPVHQVKATDADSGANAQIIYSLMAGHVDKFAVDSRNGTITTQDTFDFELEQIFEIKVKASNIGTRHLFSVAHVIIQISGVNEFIPAFQTHVFNFLVSESVPVGTRIGKVTATDYDQGYDGMVFYLLFGQSKRIGFDVDEQNGEIYTTDDLKKYGYNHAVLSILAKNWGVITGLDVDEALIHINIIDTNDPPKFSSVLYTADVNEDTIIDTSIMRVTALDQDSILEWSRFTYSIERGSINSSFSVDPLSGIVSVHSSLDRELWPLYNLTVTAIDEGSPPATGTTNVVVTISDINDNAPNVILTEGHVRENQPHGTIVTTLNASDADIPPNQGPFTYWLVKPASGGIFSLTSDGVLFTTRPVDRERNPVFHMLVAVSDAGIPPLSSTTMFHIRVLDENDNPSVQRNIYIEVKYYGSAFPGGMIGKAQPEDQDESDMFNCSIKNGPLNMFSIPFGTCELWSSPYQGEATYNITIEATDQLHPPVNNSVYVNYKGFTNASMDSCILFYMFSTPVEEFLSLKYLKFVKALDSLFNLQASKTHVFGIKPIGKEILLLAAVKSYNGQYLSGEVASGISAAHKKLLEAQSNVTISHITSDPCLINPCQNGATCNKNIHISQDVVVLESLAVIFVSPQKEIFNCTCSAGFTGTLCDSDIDECDGNPCENEGTCVNKPGGFDCLCKRGFSGLLCSADVDECLKVKCQNGGTCLNIQKSFLCNCSPGYEGKFCEQSVDHCAPSPCHQGNCSNFLAGYSCHCPFGVNGIHCEEHSYGFEELSYMEFPPLDPRSNFISLELATVQQNSLLLYNPGGPSSHEFLALEIVKGRVHLSYDLGSGSVRLETEKQVADGLFHSIIVRRIGNIGSLQVDSCADVEANGYCFTQNEGISSKRTLDVGTSNMTLGGIRSIESILLRPTQVQTHDFVGCVRNMKVNGIPLGASKSLATYNILERCPRAAASPCHSSPCQNGGVCHDLWSHYFCQCRDKYTGSNCATKISEEHVLRLNGHDYVEYIIRETYRRDHHLRDLLDEDETEEASIKHSSEIEVKVKTVEKDGVLVFVLGRKGDTVLRIVDGKLVYIFRDMTSGYQSEFTTESPVADGVWHVLHLFRDGPSTILILDGQPVMNTTEGTLDLIPLNVDKIVLGAAPPEDSSIQQSGFPGCVEYFRVNGYILPVSGYSEIVEAWPSPSLIQSSCVSPDYCFPSPCSEESTTILSCLSLPCQNERHCGGPTTINKSCICLHNITGVACEVCSSVPENRGVCSEPQGSKPFWIIAVVLPVTFLLTFLFIAQRRQSANGHCQKCQNDNLPQRREQGKDNIVFCFDRTGTPAKDVSTGGGTPPDVIWADKQRPGVECYSEASLSNFQPGVKNSELEYYEIDSIYSAFHSDIPSLSLSETSHLYKRDYERIEPRGRRRCQKTQPDPDPFLPQNIGCQGESGLLTQLDYEWRKDKEPQLFPKSLSVPELIVPPQCLSVEEVMRLSSPLEQVELHKQKLNQLAHMPWPVKPVRVIDSSSDSETHSSFTCSEFEVEREFSFISAKGVVCEQTSIVACSSKEHDILTVPSPFRDTLHLTEAQYTCRAEGTLTGGIQQWDNLLNMGLHFDTYAQVFEDMPVELKHDCDRQSDREEII